MATESSTTGSRMLLAIAILVAIVVGALLIFANRVDSKLSIHADVTIFLPQEFGIDSDTCDVSGFRFEIAGNDEVISVHLGQGESLGSGDDTACRFLLTVSAPKSDRYTFSAPGSPLPTRSIDRVFERLEKGPDPKTLSWVIWLEP